MLDLLVGPNGAAGVEMRPTADERAYTSLMEPVGAQVPLLRPMGQPKLNSIGSFCPKRSTLDLKPTPAWRTLSSLIEPFDTKADV